MIYYRNIDGLRCFAILLVLLAHFGFVIGDRISAGYYGVDLFFVISGFLITNILLGYNEKSLSNSFYKFIGRRSLRIFPIYFLTIIVLWLLRLPAMKEGFVWFATYTYNYAGKTLDPKYTPVNHFWSLCVEEQFYLFWPLIILLLRDRFMIMVIFVVVMIGIGTSQYAFGWIVPFVKYKEVGLVTKMASLGTGALIAILRLRNLLSSTFFVKKSIEYFVFIILFVVMAFNPSPESKILTLVYFKPIILCLCSFYLVVKATYYKFSIDIVNRFLEHKWVVYIGTISYGIYVYHYPVAYYFERFVFNPIWLSINFEPLGYFKVIRWSSWVFKLPIYSALSIGLASLSYHYIEHPILNLKNKLFKQNDNAN